MILDMESTDRHTTEALLDEVRTLRRNLLLAVRTVERFVERKQSELARLSQCEAELGDLRTHHLRLTGRHEQTVVLKDRLRARLEVAVRHARRWRDEAEEAERQRLEATARRKTAERALATIRKREAALRQRLERRGGSEDDLTRAEAERDEARRTADLLRDELGDLRAEMGALEERLQSGRDEGEVEVERARAARALEEAELLRGQVADLERRLEVALEAASASAGAGSAPDDGALVAARIRAGELEAKLEAALADRDDLTARLEDAEGALTEAEDQQLLLADRLAEAEAALEAPAGAPAGDAGGDELAAARSELEALADELDAATAELASVTAELKTTSTELDTVTVELDGVVAERDRLRDQVEMLAADLRRLRAAAADPGVGDAEVAEVPDLGIPERAPAIAEDTTNEWALALALDPPTEPGLAAPAPPARDELEPPVGASVLEVALSSEGETGAAEEPLAPSVNLGVTEDMVDQAIAWLTCQGLPSVPLVPGFTLTLGRKRAACDIVLPNRQVSRTQARLLVQDEEVLLEDLSKNGTFVNGSRIERAQLAPGDQLSVGPYRLALAEAPDPAAPPLETAPVFLDELS